CLAESPRVSAKRVLAVVVSEGALVAARPHHPRFAVALPLAGAGPVFYPAHRSRRHNLHCTVHTLRTVREGDDCASLPPPPGVPPASTSGSSPVPLPDAVMGVLESELDDYLRSSG